MQLIDTHCHLYMEQFDLDVDEVITNATSQNISKIVVPGVDIISSQRAITLAEKYSNVFAAVGIHPNEGNKWEKCTFTEISELANHPKVVAIGEIGLDFHWDDCPKNLQQEIFEKQLDLAKIKCLPVIIHSRNSLNNVIITIQNWKSGSQFNRTNELSGILHSFEGDLESAQVATDLGFLIGIGGPVTYKNSIDKQNIAEKLDLNWIVLETDAPFLSPHPFRGKRNKPEYINLIAEKIAQIRKTQIKLISQATTKNADKLFAWEP
ncbi:MAG: TatD family hydrolase [Anaerolineaceae bacterium]